MPPLSKGGGSRLRGGGILASGNVTFNAQDILTTSVFTLAAGYTYQFGGLLDKIAKNSTLTQYDGSGKEVATWYFYKDDQLLFPDLANGDTMVYKGANKTIGGTRKILPCIAADGQDRIEYHEKSR